jgi:hypothetical protein
MESEWQITLKDATKLSVAYNANPGKYKAKYYTLSNIFLRALELHYKHLKKLTAAQMEEQLQSCPEIHPKEVTAGCTHASMYPPLACPFLNKKTMVCELVCFPCIFLAALTTKLSAQGREAISRIELTTKGRVSMSIVAFLIETLHVCAQPVVRIVCVRPPPPSPSKATAIQTGKRKAIRVYRDSHAPLRGVLSMPLG